MKLLIALLSGLLFGFGLALSGMTNTAKVIGFLDVFGAWDSDLLFVMGGAVVTTAVGFALILRRSKPLMAEKFSMPATTVINPRLLLGASLFGIGWGLYGYCPGPALAALVYLSPVTLLFVATMVIGMWVGDKIKI